MDNFLIKVVGLMMVVFVAMEIIQVGRVITNSRPAANLFLAKINHIVGLKKSSCKFLQMMVGINYMDCNEVAQLVDKLKVSDFEYKTPKPSIVLYQLGKKELDQGNLKGAVLWWEAAINLSPDWGYFWTELAALMVKSNQVDLAEKILNICHFYPSAYSTCFDMRYDILAGKILPGHFDGVINSIKI